ncbi:acyl-CoA dehydrogenase family protein [Novosphingobium pentaromativorans]|uniref:Acyl-CoA dehydrogenase n=1 Tax=Novosphingobium pentaromativorans US6-1 TaxID=1088721 RepID=G6EGR2_9SPHN|nr:acyl-CoA dehydrogenase family protein [Novosphingobium pentaromativorans]EHJ59505.1 acyl-CoA dehydrogenase [Novosphingobium pentaromativorans US6-1]
MVEADRAGFSRGKKLKKIGLKAQDTAEIFLEDVRVPASNLIGEENRGFYQMMKELAQERLVQAVRGQTILETAIEWTKDYVRERPLFGRTVADFQNTRFKLAEMHAQASVMRVYVDRCIAAHMAGELDATEAAIAKMTCVELQGKVLDECLQLHGGWGYIWEYPIARAYADARIARIAGGSIEVMKQIISNSILPKDKRS